MICSILLSVDVGTEADKQLDRGPDDVAGTDSLSNEELQKEWYCKGTEFALAPGKQPAFVSGLDAQFENSIDPMMQLIRSPSADEQTLEQLKHPAVPESKEFSLRQSPGSL